MYAHERLRYRATIYEIHATLRAMALDARAFPGVIADVRQLKSSASTPSLRSRESSEVLPIRSMTPDGGAGNVRVVVRVRGFLPRGVIDL